MTLEKLLEQHNQETNDYRQERARRLLALQKSQNEILVNYTVLNKKTRKVVDALLTKQRETWEQMEKDEYDLLVHVQSQEKEFLMEQEKKRQRIADSLTSAKDKSKDRGR
ncbi:hypothetical protein A3860_33725 [Niastella vici]|uniref:Flagellar FliJ protein n=1 Tax=Niastella vici TaxID=1703345 RepID=A0A1V9FPZ4_9BACT|nr:hypothetical protein [Niastella vici]OQP60341.1 hypothetical protein A3860_33725 [Niastella vici]